MAEVHLKFPKVSKLKFLVIENTERGLFGLIALKKCVIPPEREREMPWSSAKKDMVMVQKAAGSNFGLSQPTTRNFCQPGSKWVPFMK